MFIALLCIGLVASAFAATPFSDLREIKMEVAVVCALALCMAEFYRNGLQPLRNKWLAFLIIYLPISIHFAPAPDIALVGIMVSKFWSWQPFFHILVFYFLASAIASHEFTPQEIRKTLVTIAWCGFIMAVYIIMQRFGADQFFVRSVGQEQGPTASYAGFLANPTLSAPFVAMTVPFMLHLKKYWMLPVAALGIYFPDSQMAYGGLVCALALYFASKGRYRFVTIASISAICLLLAVAFRDTPAVKNSVHDNERFHHWTEIAKEMAEPLNNEPGAMSFPFTGRGLGAFKFIYHVQNPGQPGYENRFHQAHNDYLEFAYNTGVVGLFLFGAALVSFFRSNFSLYRVYQIGEDERSMAVLSAFLCAAVVAFGTFIWQVGTVAFYSTVFVGLLYNESFKRRIT